MLKLINEASYKSNKKYKCPFCEGRYTRNDLYTHIEDEHDELVTETYPVGRIVYNTVNHTECGRCMMCKKVTKWDDDKQKYDPFCSDKCKEEYVKMAKERMKKKYGKEYILDDPEQQKKMLEGRKISGYYTFTSGGKLPYVGSYEKNFLEFMDKFLHVKVRDIIPSFPIVNYKDNDGVERFWILDFYYAPLNLAIDIKDGGNNPNNREMPEYREKQNAKEYAIVSQKEYNYLRLEDNNFEQLILTMMEMKELPEEEIQFNPQIKGMNRYSYIPESVGTAGTIVGIGSEPEMIRQPNLIYFIRSDKFGLSPRFGISKDKTLRNLVFPNDEFKLEAFDISYLNDSICRVYEYTDNNVDYNYQTLLESIKEGSEEFFTAKKLYKHFTGRDLIDFDQLNYDEGIHECISFPEYLKIMESSLLATWTDDISIPMLESTDDSCIYEYAQDINGYYVYNKETGYRSRSYDSIEEIPSKVITYISKGLI